MAQEDGTAGAAGPSYDEWMDLAAEEYRRLDGLLRELGPEEWSRPTDCDEWDVRAMVAHLVGGACAAASVRELVRQAAVGLRIRRHGELVDKINAVQVLERADRSPVQLVADLAAAADRALRARRRLPRLVRMVPVPMGPPAGVRRLEYLMGRIYTRDEWLHRIDICRATGREPRLSDDHDGRLVGDVVHEWAASHDSSYTLELTGPAGGTWRRGEDGPRLRLDAVEFARTVSGRAPGSGLLATRVLF